MPNEFIRYATKPEQLNKIFYEKCLFYKPKDIVGGDFYWVIDREDSI